MSYETIDSSMSNMKCLDDLQNYPQFHVKYAEPSDAVQNYRSFRIKSTKSLDDLRNYLLSV
jgi:hypothetical protein